MGILELVQNPCQYHTDTIIYGVMIIRPVTTFHPDPEPFCPATALSVVLRVLILYIITPMTRALILTLACRQHSNVTEMAKSFANQEIKSLEV